jgi:biopolymer transport protein ExbD
MAMSIGSDGGDEEVISAINTTPLVDVMLVLFIIFLITSRLQSLKILLFQWARMATFTGICSSSPTQMHCLKK